MENATDIRKEHWVTKKELAAHLGFSTRWIEHRLRDGLPHARFGSQARFKISVVESWLQNEWPSGSVSDGLSTGKELIGAQG